MDSSWDVVVVGGGHAGCEAALAAARMGARTLLITANPSQIARMPCNPSIGGPAKAHLVREVDALGGEMARVIDRSHLHIRMLNTGSGPAVQALRAQADRPVYSASMRAVVLEQSGLSVWADEVEDLQEHGARVVGVRCRSGRVLRAGAVVLTTGTFLGGALHLGATVAPGGRSGEAPALELSRRLRARGWPVHRMKTGTSPRLHRDTIDTSAWSAQPGSQEPLVFSELSDLRLPDRQVVCHLSWTTPETRRIVLENLHLSPRAQGTVRGPGPRYCPSLEDKFIRFPERQAHQVFLEPEGFETPEVYLQGLSTSLPLPVQIALVRSLPGCERAEVLRPGYAVEYDVLDPRRLEPTLEARDLRRLFLAGQINGTSGYEEAAAQGLLAGVNAALAVGGGEGVVLSRDQAYLGVMIDDLVTRGVTEPYRMHTSRAEYRLLLRQDNAPERLTPLGRRVGLVDERRWSLFLSRAEGFSQEMARLSARTLGGAEAAELEAWSGVPVSGGARMLDLVRRPELSLQALRRWEGLQDLDPRVVERVEIALRYEGYIARQRAEVERVRRWEAWSIPSGFSFEGLAGVSAEAVERWSACRPVSLGQAGRVPGVTPADVSALSVHLRVFQEGAA